MSAGATVSLNKKFALDPGILGPASSASLELGATLITADPDFRKIGNKLKVEFLPKHESFSQT